MSEKKTCDLCKWPIEEWQKSDHHNPLAWPIGEHDAYVKFTHANPADHKPTRKPEQTYPGDARI